MTNTEAKEKLERFKPFLSDDYWKETYQLAIDALEKQIPKKIEHKPIDDNGIYNTNICPTCNEEVFYKVKHCYKCGQYIDWTVE